MSIAPSKNHLIADTGSENKTVRQCLDEEILDLTYISLICV